MAPFVKSWALVGVYTVADDSAAGFNCSSVVRSRQAVATKTAATAPSQRVCSRIGLPGEVEGHDEALQRGRRGLLEARDLGIEAAVLRPRVQLAAGDGERRRRCDAEEPLRKRVRRRYLAQLHERGILDVLIDVAHRRQVTDRLGEVEDVVIVREVIGPAQRPSDEPPTPNQLV